MIDLDTKLDHLKLISMILISESGTDNFGDSYLELKAAAIEMGLDIIRMELSDDHIISIHFGNIERYIEYEFCEDPFSFKELDNNPHIQKLPESYFKEIEDILDLGTLDAI